MQWSGKSNRNAYIIVIFNIEQLLTFIKQRYYSVFVIPSGNVTGEILLNRQILKFTSN